MSGMKKIAPSLIPVIWLLTCSTLLEAQQVSNSQSYDHHHKHHELGIGTGVVLFPEASSLGYAIHLHGIVGITEWMGIGPGYELILGEHTHHTISGLLHFHPFHPIDINLGPGVVFPDEELSEYRFKLHAEIATVFELGEHLHLGPSVDAGIGKEDLHITFGIHLGYILH